MDKLFPYSKILKKEFCDIDYYYFNYLRKNEEDFNLLFSSKFELPIVFNNFLELELLPYHKRKMLYNIEYLCKFTNIKHKHLTDDIYFNRNFYFFIFFCQKKYAIHNYIHRLIFNFSRPKTYCIFPIGQPHYYPKILQMRKEITTYLEKYYLDKYLLKKKNHIPPGCINIICCLRNDYLNKNLSLTDLVTKILVNLLINKSYS